MLHEAIFLATCNASMTTERHCKLQRGCHTFATFFRNLHRARWKLCTALSPVASLKSPRAKDALSLTHFTKIGLQVAMDMSHAATCLATLRKVEYSPTFLATHKATFCCTAGRKNGVSHVKSFLQLAAQRLLRQKLQEKLPRVTWPLRTFALIVFAHPYCARKVMSQWRHVIHRARALRKICRQT